MIQKILKSSITALLIMVIGLSSTAFGAANEYEYVGTVKSDNNFLKAFSGQDGMIIVGCNDEPVNINNDKYSEITIKEYKFENGLENSYGSVFALNGDKNNIDLCSTQTGNIYILAKGNNSNNQLFSFSQPFSSDVHIDESRLLNDDVEMIFGYGEKLAYCTRFDNCFNIYELSWENNKAVCNEITNLIFPNNAELQYLYSYSDKILMIVKNTDNMQYVPWVFENGEWHMKSVLPNGTADLENCGIGAYGNKLMFCGKNTLGETDTFMYDIIKDKWLSVAYNLGASSKVSCVVHGDYLYALEETNEGINISRMPLVQEMNGDVDRDGVLTANDAALIMEYTLNMGSGCLDNEQIKIAEVTGDGIIMADDAAAVMQKVLNSSFCLPVDKIE